jgi:hypothetical protein
MYGSAMIPRVAKAEQNFPFAQRGAPKKLMKYYYDDVNV